MFSFLSRSRCPLKVAKSAATTILLLSGTVFVRRQSKKLKRETQQILTKQEGFFAFEIRFVQPTTNKQATTQHDSDPRQYPRPTPAFLVF